MTATSSPNGQDRLAATRRYLIPEAEDAARIERTVLDPDLEREVMERVVAAINEAFAGGSPRYGNDEDAWRVHALIERCVHAVLREHASDPGFRPPPAPEAIVERIFDDLIGLAGLQPLLRNPAYESIEVIGTRVWVLQRGVRRFYDAVLFRNVDEVIELARRVAGRLGAELNEGQPRASVRLPDGSRFAAILPPVSRFPVVTIRLHRLRRVTLEELVATWALLPPDAAALLDAAVRARCNLVISGPANTGKTTLLRALAARYAQSPEELRPITLELVAELGLEEALPATIALEARRAQTDGTGEITLRDLLREALLHNPDIFIVGECRGGEALDLLQAMNTGHDGSMTTLHANSPEEMISRLATMAAQTPERLPAEHIDRMIGKTVQLVVQLGWRPGTRQRAVTEIYELHEVTPAGPVGHALWAWRDGALRQTDLEPRLLDRFAQHKVPYQWRRPADARP